MYVYMVVVCAQSCLTLRPMAPLSVEFSRQEYWSGLPFPSQGDLLNPEMEPGSLVSLALQADFLPLVPPRKPKKLNSF